MNKFSKINFLIWSITFIFLITLNNYSFCDEEKKDSNKSNLEIIQETLGKFTKQILTVIPDKDENILGFKIHQTEQSWIVEHAVINEILSRGYKIKLIKDSENTTPYIFKVGDAGAKIIYSSMHRKGLKKFVQRSISVSLQAQVIESKTGNVILSNHFKDEYRDTVNVDDINIIEDKNIPMTRAELPDESIIDRLIEPIIIIGATGVAIFLLFHIRS